MPSQVQANPANPCLQLVHERAILLRIHVQPILHAGLRSAGHDQRKSEKVRALCQQSLCLGHIRHEAGSTSVVKN